MIIVLLMWYFEVFEVVELGVDGLDEDVVLNSHGVTKKI